MLLIAEHHLSPTQTEVSEVYSVIFWAIFINCCFNTGYPSNTGQMIPILRNDELRWMFDEQELLFAGMLLVEQNIPQKQITVSHHKTTSFILTAVRTSNIT